MGRNIAENCARLGLSVALVTAFGDDEGSRWLEDTCGKSGISTAESLRVPGPCAAYLCLLDADGSLAGAVADMDIMEEITPSFLGDKRELFDAATIIVADANLPEASLGWLAHTYGRGSRHRLSGEFPLLFLDPVSSAKAARIRGLSMEFDCIKPNLAEARIIAGSVSEGAEDIVAKMETEGTMPGELFISLGPRGIFFSGRGERGRIALPPASMLPPVASRSGAGDAAMAAIVHARLEGRNMAAAARMALAAAVLASSSIDTVSNQMTVSGLEALMPLFPDAGIQPGRT